jgi:hypothetical protein
MTPIAEFLVSILAIAAFTLVLYKTTLPGVVRDISAAAMRGLSAMLDSELDDDGKEAAIRGAGLALIAGTFRASWRLVLALGAAAAAVLLAGPAGIAAPADTLALMLRVDYILGVSAAAIFLGWAVRRRAGGAGADAAQTGAGTATGYGFGDRFFHMLAFSGAGFQRAMARLDDRLFARRIAAVPDLPPIFVTSLARGGTTALLNAFHEMPGIATHLYRDMPFVTAPLLWSKLGGHGRRSVARRARAHGDGLEIDLDSPEAFDEVLWKLYWPDHYGAHAITPWTPADARAAARDSLARHFRKIALLRRPGRLAAGEAPVRYLSKNNANIGRLDLLPAMFPGCDIVIALRRPAAHAASLLRQHRNFRTLHAEDEFTRRYMRDIGHFEFGALHRPIAFDGVEPGADTADPDYWLRYWIAAFRALLPVVGRCHVVTQDALRAHPQATMQALAARLKLDTGGLDFTRHFRPVPDTAPEGLFDPDLLEEAETLYTALAGHAVR